MEKAESYLARWQAAGLLDEQAAARIREWEAAQEAPAGRQWQVLLTLILGGILLGAGVLLFVAAHWDRVSPGGAMGTTGCAEMECAVRGARRKVGRGGECSA